MNVSISRVLAIVLLLGASTGHPDSARASPLRALVPQTTAALPFLQMARVGAPAGVELKVDFFANHAQALAILLLGEADLLLSGTSQGWENWQSSSPSRLLVENRSVTRAFSGVACTTRLVTRTTVVALLPLSDARHLEERKRGGCLRHQRSERRCPG